MEKNFTELHVEGVYLRRDGEVELIAFKGEDGAYFGSSKGNWYTREGTYLYDEEHPKDLIHYLCDFEDIKRIPEIIEKSKILDKLINKLEEYKHKSGDEADEIAWEDYHTLVRAKFLINNAGLYL